MRSIRKIILLILIPVVSFLLYGIYQSNQVPNIKAAGDLTIRVGGKGINGNPIFEFDNFAPGDFKEVTIEVANGDSVDRHLSIKGRLTEDNKDLGEVLFLEIFNGSDEIILGGPGEKMTIEDFFDRGDPDNPKDNGFPLFVVESGDSKELKIKVIFSPEADNEYQDARVVFDLIFGIITGEDLVINEVFYNVDDAHGSDSYGDRNSPRGVRQEVGRNNEWVELFNPTGETVSLKGWVLRTQNGETEIRSNKKLKPGEFALVSKDASTWRHWDEERSALKVEVGEDIGGGLGNNGGYLMLINPDDEDVDFVAWGKFGDYSEWVIEVGPGDSIERIVPGFDTNSPDDWQSNQPPSPGK
jgi:hypothetical protein